MLQHCFSAGRDRAQQPHSAAGMFPDAELPALNGVDATDEGLDLLGKFLGTTEQMREKVRTLVST